MTFEEYKKLYQESLTSPETFWAAQAEKYLTWNKKWDQVLESDFANAKHAWFLGGKLNLCYNAIDRHLKTHSQKIAFYWEGDNPEHSKSITYQEAYREVNAWALTLKKRGVKKGDRVTIYLPMIPELPFAVLACARIGAIHSVVFGGFSPDAIRDRVLDAKSDFVITADGGWRSGKHIPLKHNIDEALKQTPEVRHVLVVAHTQQNIEMKLNRDLWWHEERKAIEPSAYCEPEWMNSEDPLFLLYTSGSTGKPKGVLHTTAGYGLYTAMTHKTIFDLKDSDIYFCTADVGWVTGHSYLVYGPLINGASCVLFEGVPTYPTPSRFWDVVGKYKATIFYTSPTAIRSLMRSGEDVIPKKNLSSLRILGSVGEPINPEAWRWYSEHIGGNRCPIVDTYWQTETGGIIISAIPQTIPTKPGSATLPFFGIEPVLLDENGKEISGPGKGVLCMKRPWPSLMRGVYGDSKRFYDTYFSAYKGYYFTGDGCTRDEDGYYWITGRVDDVLNVSGHRLGTAEIESALVLHPKVAEAAVVGYPHDLKGQGIYSYVTLKEGIEPSENLKQELIQFVSKEISPIAKPDKIQWAPGLPKTRSGKIMRRILRKIACGEFEGLGDTSTLADPSVVEQLIRDKA